MDSLSDAIQTWMDLHNPAVFSEGKVQHISGTTAQVVLEGRKTVVTALAPDSGILPGDKCVLVRVNRNSRWIILGTYGSGLAGQNDLRQRSKVTEYGARKGFISGLQVQVGNSAGTSMNCTIQPGTCVDSGGNVLLTNSAPITIDLDTPVIGANGKDSDFTLSGTDEYPIFLIGSHNGITPAGLISDSQTPTLPNGYSVYRRVGSAMGDNSGGLLNTRMYGKSWEVWVYYIKQYAGGPDPLTLAIALDLTNGAWTEIASTSPASADHIYAFVRITPTSTYQLAGKLRSTDAAQWLIISNHANVYEGTPITLPLNEDQSFYFLGGPYNEKLIVWQIGYRDVR